MWHEYAIEPAALVASWERFCTFRAGLGWSKGRLLWPHDRRRFGAELIRLIGTQHADMGEIRQRSFEERAQEIIETASSPRPQSTQANTDWLAAVTVAHARRPFHARIALSAQPDFIAVDNLDVSETPWNRDLDHTISRDARQLAEIARPLFEANREITLIDPWFSPRKQQCSKALEAYLDLWPGDGRDRKITIHASVDVIARDGAPAPTTADVDELKRLARQHWSGSLCSGQVIEYKVWQPQQERHHGRYLLGTRSGLHFEGGTDAGPHTETSTVHIMSQTLADEQRRRFESSPPIHGLFGRFAVT